MKKTIIGFAMASVLFLGLAASTLQRGEVTTSRVARQLLTNETPAEMRSYLGIGTNAELYDLSGSTNLPLSGMSLTARQDMTNAWNAAADSSADAAETNVGPRYDLKHNQSSPDNTPVNSQQLKRLKAKIYNGQKITMSFLGDSVGQDVQPAIESALLPWMGRAGGIGASTPYYLGNYFYNGASGTRTDNLFGSDGIYWAPFSMLGNGAVLTVASAVSNGISGDSIGLAWYQSSGFGTLLIETQRVSGAWGTLTTVDGSGGAGLTMATTNITVPFASDYYMRITSTGTNIPVSMAIRDTRSGVGFISSSTKTDGFAPLSFMRNAGSNNVAKFLLWQNPDVVFYKAERGTSDTNDLPWFDTLLSNTVPNCELVLIAHHASWNSNDSVNVRNLFLDNARSRGRVFVDVWAESQPYSNSYYAGLYSDATHLENVGRAVLHSRIPSQLGLGASEMAVLRRTWPGGDNAAKANLAGGNTFSGDQVVDTGSAIQGKTTIVAKPDAGGRATIGLWNREADQQFVYERIGNHWIETDSVLSYSVRSSISNDGSGTLLIDHPNSFKPAKFGPAKPFDYYGAFFNLSSNAPSEWPSSPLRPGDSVLVNSNGMPFVLRSGLSGSWESTNVLGDIYGNNGSRLTNVFSYVSTLGGDGNNINPYVVLNNTNPSTPPELLYRPGSVTGGAENNIISYTQTKRGQAPRGVSTWNVFGADTNVFHGQAITNLVNRMVTNGMVRLGVNNIMLDEGYSFRGNGAGTPTYPAAVGWDYSYDANRIFRADTNRFPQGLKAVVDYAHLNGIKVHLYCSSALFGSAGYWMPFGSNHVDLVNNVSNLVNWVGIDGFKFESGFNGNLHEFVNEAVRWGKPIWINAPADNGYEPQFADTVNAWRTGTGLYGDINGMPSRLYQWADVANFSMIRPGHGPDFDLLYSQPAYWAINIPQIKTAGTKYTGTANIWAMAAMANANMWFSGLPAYEGGSTRYASFYEDYNNPLVNSIQGDFTKPMWKQSSNYLAVTYGKWLADGGVAVLIQNRSDTNKTEVINFDSYFGNHYPTMVQSTNANIATVRDVMRNVTLGYYTNSYTTDVAYTNIAWVKINKGITEQYAPGTNYLSDYGWAYVTNYPDNNPGMTVNYTYLPYGNGKIFINSTIYDHGFYSAHGNFVRLKYPLHKQADYFSATVWNRFNGANTGVNIYTNDVLAQTVLMPTTGSVSNILCGVTNADWITIELTNAQANAAFTIADPLIFCRGQTKVDEQGRQVRTLHESVINAAFAAASTPVLAGNGVNITNVGESLIYFDSIPLTGFTRLSPNAPGASPSTLFAGFSGTGAATRRGYVYVPGWVTNAIFYGMVIQSSAISTWTNLIEPSFQASDGRFVGSGGGLNSSNEVCTIEAANAVSNYTFTVKWPATNVNVKGFQFSFLQATNTSATHYIGPVMKVRYNP